MADSSGGFGGDLKIVSAVGARENCYVKDVVVYFFLWCCECLTAFWALDHPVASLGSVLCGSI